MRPCPANALVMLSKRRDSCANVEGDNRHPGGRQQFSPGRWLPRRSLPPRDDSRLPLTILRVPRRRKHLLCPDGRTVDIRLTSTVTTATSRNKHPPQPSPTARYSTTSTSTTNWFEARKCFQQRLGIQGPLHHPDTAEGPAPHPLHRPPHHLRAPLVGRARRERRLPFPGDVITVTDIGVAKD